MTIARPNQTHNRVRTTSCLCQSELSAFMLLENKNKEIFEVVQQSHTLIFISELMAIKEGKRQTLETFRFRFVQRKFRILNQNEGRNPKSDKECIQTK